MTDSEAKSNGNSVPSTRSIMAASALAGMAARIPCHPIDTCKARLQVQTKSASSGGGLYRNFVHAFAATARAEGMRGLYRGFTVAFMGSAPAACLYFTTYEKSKRALEELPQLRHGAFAGHFMAGLVAETVSCLLWVPIDVIKERMQIQRAGAAGGAGGAGMGVYYRGPVHAVTEVMKHEGIVGLYRGYGATLMSFGPFSALYFMFYEKLKAASQWVVGEQDIPGPLIVTSAAGAGALAACLTNPLDMVKLRLQVQRGQRAAQGAGTQQALPFHYRGTLHGLSSIVRTEGPAALFKGVGARMLFHAPSTAIAMSAFEALKREVPLWLD